MFISQIATGLQNDYNEHTEGWVIKKYQGQNTLNVFSSEGKTTENVSSSSSASSADLENNAKAAAQILSNVIQSGGRLLVLTGAGMSVSSGVPVFRAADGTMSEDFLHFLRNYNIARTANGLEEADDWFSFSVPEMFRKETEKEAWAYWKWRITRSVVEPAEDYSILNTIMGRFSKECTFVKTSNCDMLHERSGVDGNRIHEIHGSLGRLQCSNKCSDKMYPMNAAFVNKLSTETDYVPRCIECNEACLRPNVMIFGDNKLVHKELQAQENRFQQFIDTCPNISSFSTQKRKQGDDTPRLNLFVLEIGAGTVVPSIRYDGEGYGSLGVALVRVNPSENECSKFEVNDPRGSGSDYFPLQAYSNVALGALLGELNELKN